MFLYWAGQPLYGCISQKNKTSVIQAITVAFMELYKLCILYCDVEPRNVLYDANYQKVMIVDFERAEFYSRQPLGSISTNSRKRKCGGLQKQERDRFMLELDYIKSFEICDW